MLFLTFHNLCNIVSININTSFGEEINYMANNDNIKLSLEFFNEMEKRKNDYDPRDTSVVDTIEARASYADKVIELGIKEGILGDESIELTRLYRQAMHRGSMDFVQSAMSNLNEALDKVTLAAKNWTPT